MGGDRHSFWRKPCAKPVSFPFAPSRNMFRSAVSRTEKTDFESMHFILHELFSKTTWLRATRLDALYSGAIDASIRPGLKRFQQAIPSSTKSDPCWSRSGLVHPAPSPVGKLCDHKFPGLCAHPCPIAFCAPSSNPLRNQTSNYAFKRYRREDRVPVAIAQFFAFIHFRTWSAKGFLAM